MRSDLRPMNFAERLVAGPPVLATVARKPEVGDLVIIDSEFLDEVFEVTRKGPTIVNGPLPLRLRSLLTGQHVDAANRAVVGVLTKAEAKAARKHYEEN